MPHKLDYKTPIVSQPSKPAYFAFGSLSIGALSATALFCGSVLPGHVRAARLIPLVCVGFLLGIASLIIEPEKSLAWLGMLLSGIVVAILGYLMIFAQRMFGGMTW